MSKSKKEEKPKREIFISEAEEGESNVVIPETAPDIRPVTISIDGFRHINRSFPISDLSVTAKYLNQDLGQSPKFPVTDDEIVEASHKFTLECNLSSPTEIDSLVSNPVLFTITESYGSFDLSAYSNITEPSLPQVQYHGLSAESQRDLFNMFQEVEQVEDICPVPVPVSVPVPEKEKPAVEAVISKETISKKVKRKESMVTKTNKPEKVEELLGDTTPRTVGTCTLDMISLFLGQEQVVQTIPIVPCYRIFDENMVVWRELPKLVISVTVEPKWELLETKLTNLLSLTIESMYNIPQVMVPEMEYCACVMLPSQDAVMEPVVLCNGAYKITKDIDQVKFWPGLPKTSDLRTATNYRIDSNIDDIQNQTDVNLEDILFQDVPRIEWNYLRRRYLSEEGYANFYAFIKNYRSLVIEVVMRTRRATIESEIEVDEMARIRTKSNSDRQSVKSFGNGKSKKLSKSGYLGEYLHLMAVVDVSALLYPGVNKLHIACPLTTFHDNEAFEAVGLRTPHFISRPDETQEESSVKKDNKKLRGIKSAASLSSGSSLKKEKKSGTRKESAEGKNLQELLPPPPPPPPEPSRKLYNEDGQRTFIVLEIELLRPIAKKREIEDINSELQSLFSTKPQLPKEIVTARLAHEMYRETIRKLTDDLNYHYVEYLKDVEKCECGGDSATTKPDFVTYLNRIGVYPTYLSSLTKTAAMIVKNKFVYNGTCDLSDPNYESFISEVFSYLIEEMNTVINEIVTYGMEAKPIGSLAALDALLLYAREAYELNAVTLAERYHLERVTRDEKNPDYWFDYAVFLLEINHEDKAFECVRKALAIDLKHRYCLILAGFLLTNKKQLKEAETCFLSLTSEYPFWVEGWGALLTFYKHIGRYDGEQGCLTVIKKAGSNNEHKIIDYFTGTDDLAWTASICPDDPFFRIAVILIKLRCYHYAEIALSYIIPTKKSGIIDYLSAVICYYRKQYQLALKHMERAENLHGLDYGTASLKGHCLLAAGFSRQALKAYTHVLKSYSRPDDIHMVYVKAAVVLEDVQDLQEARKLMLLVCKYSPTPYTWMTAGLLYYKQNDLLSAEACLTEANTCDRKLPEIWAYLALINVQLDRLTEAEFCQREALKTNLTDEELLNRMVEALNGLKK